MAAHCAALWNPTKELVIPPLCYGAERNIHYGDVYFKPASGEAVEVFAQSFGIAGQDSLLLQLLL